MKYIKKIQIISSLVFALSVICFSVVYAGLSAFPGAEGAGANSIGGRGGIVIKVKNLNDHGAGSLREALETNAHRTIVFDVSGIINLESPLRILRPFVTIAGETSPGGILLASYMLYINTNDVIIRHLRVRTGSHRIGAYNALTNPYGMNADAESLDALQIWGPYGGAALNEAYNIIIDHCSFSWSVDELSETAYNPRNITYQWSMFSEALSLAGHPKTEHSKGPFWWGQGLANNPMRISFHHNYIAHNKDRNPLATGGSPSGFIVDLRNNIFYNFYGGNGPLSHGSARINWVHNYIKPGPISNVGGKEIHQMDEIGETPVPSLYVIGNIGSSRMVMSGDEWDTVGDGFGSLPVDSKWRALTPWEVSPVSTSPMSSSVADCILSAVGATAPTRDSVDARVISDFATGTGKVMNNVTYPDDYPVFKMPAPPADNDNDGMADSWESSNGLNITINDADLDKDDDGYTNIEEYLHHMSNISYQFNSACMPFGIKNITISP